MNKLTHIIHSLFCKKNHLYEIEKLKQFSLSPEVCMFYIEESFDQTWEMRDHKEWLEKTKSLQEDLNFKSPQEAFILITKLISVMRPLNEFLGLHQELKKLSIVLLEEV